MTQTYKRDYECDNCGIDGQIEIAYGVKAAKEIVCPHCGVEGARILPIKRGGQAICLPTVFTPPYVREPGITITSPDPQPLFPPQYPPGTIFNSHMNGVEQFDACG